MQTINLPFINYNLSSNDWHWEMNISATGGPGQLFNTTSKQQNVSRIVISTGGQITNTTTLNFTVFDETTLAALNATTLDMNIVVRLAENENNLSLNRTYSFSRNSGASASHEFYIYPSYASYEVEAIAPYSKTGFTQRIYYIVSGTLNNQTQNISLYLLSTGNGTNLQVNVQDQFSSPMEGVVINLYRYYPSTGTYSLVAKGNTDIFGKDVFDVVYNTTALIKLARKICKKLLYG